MEEVKGKSVNVVIGIIVIFIINSITVFMNSSTIIKFIVNSIPEGIEVISLSPGDVLSTAIGISVLISFIILIPLILYYLLSYLKDVLYDREKILIYKILTFGTLLFFFGAILAFVSFIYFGLDWFANFNIRYGIETLWSIQETINTILIISFISGMIFELPMVLFFLIEKSIIDFKLNNQKRLVLLLFVTLTLGILTPDGSMFTQVILTAPIWILIESSVSLGNRYKVSRKIEKEVEE